MPQKTLVNDVLKLSKQGYTDADIIKHLRSEGYSSREINDAINQAKVKMELTKGVGTEGRIRRELGGIAGMEIPVLEEGEYDNIGEVPEAEALETSEEVAEDEMMPSIMEQEEAEALSDEYAPEYTESEVPAPGEEYEYTEAPAMDVEAAPSEIYPYPYEAKPASTEVMEELAEEIINEKWDEFKAKVGDITELRSSIESKLKQMENRIKRLELAFDKVQLGVVSQIKQYGSKIESLSSEIQALQRAFSQILQPLISSVKELREISEEVKTKKTKTPEAKAKIAKLKKIVSKAEMINEKKK